ncbi:hypothetical protein [Ornithinimicrobium cerasi]|uniref:hypothetical protein n=1 Tax=Ornithinimicrobium cerasi TaxID=2248773 RepID=UPI000EFE7D77|nr:hypothetical protein [Ornithinimicrobium cerasi]
MWTHGMSATATWWMWALMALATVGFWVLVAVVVRMVVTRSGPGQHTAPTTADASGFPVDPVPQNHRSWMSPPPLPVPDPVQTSPQRHASRPPGDRVNPTG